MTHIRSMNVQRVTGYSRRVAMCVVWTLTLITFHRIASSAILANQAKSELETLRSEASRLQTQGNWKDALQKWERLVIDPANTGPTAASDLGNAFQCLNQLGKLSSLDELLHAATQAHPRDWRVVSKAAELLLSAPHHGVIQQKQFTRNPVGNQTGTWVTTTEQDRLQVLRWLVAAMPEVDKQAKGVEAAGYYLQLANSLLFMRGDRSAWLLQNASDVSVVPDYNDVELSQSNAHRFASVDSQGEPILFRLPVSWESATNDGERLRWALAQSQELDASIGNQALWLWATFLNSQFSVDTLQQEMWLMRGMETSGENGKKDSQGIHQIHTLADTETIAKLASGIRRFTLPDEFNPIKLFQLLSQSKSHGEAAFHQLANIHTNRRQYPLAVKDWKESKTRFGDSHRSKQNQIDQIVDARGTFDPVDAQPAGRGATLGMVFRNATKVRLEAQKIDLEKYLAAEKKFYKEVISGRENSFAGQRGMYPPGLNSIGQLFSVANFDQFVVGKAAQWTMDLQPRENHWDRRIEVTTPLQNAGLYVVTAHLDGGKHKIRTCVLLQDTCIMNKTVDGKTTYWVVDAINGQPLKDMNVEFFGFSWNQSGNRNQPAHPTHSFAKKTNADGRVDVIPRDLPENYQWTVIARSVKPKSGDSRLAILGFDGIYFQRMIHSAWNEIRAFGISDRPVYRPGDSVQAKFWIARASYAPDIQGAPMSNVPMLVRMMDPQGTVAWESHVTTDRYGGVNVEVPTKKTAGLGVYRFLIGHAADNWLSSELSVRLEEYRKPEFEVEVTAPTESVVLGEKIEATVTAKYYFGSPVTDAIVNVRVQRTAFTDNYYPAAPYDWCYGPGYWWLAYDYTWYPGWKNWRGCLTPWPWWIPRNNEPPEQVLEQELALDANGQAKIVIDSALAKSIQGDQDHRYSIVAEVRDASRRTIVAQGSVIAARHPFKVYAWTDKGHYRVGDTILASAQLRTMDGKSIQGSGTLELLKIRYDQSGKPVEDSLQQWKVASDDTGNLEQKMSADRSGQYRLKWMIQDRAGREIEGGYVFTIRGEKMDAGDFRFDALELIPDRSTYRPGDQVQLQINSRFADARVLLFVRPESGVYPEPITVQLRGKSGVVEIDIQAADQPNFFIEGVTVFDGAVHQVSREMIVPPENRVLDVALEMDREQYLPGQESIASVRVTDASGKPVQGSTVVAVYDRSLEAIAPDVLPRDIREFFWKWRRQHQSTERHSLAWMAYPVWINNVPAWSPLGIFGPSLADDATAIETGYNSSRLGLGKVQSQGMPNVRMRGMKSFGGGGMGGNMDLAMDMRASPAPTAMMADEGAIKEAVSDAVMGAAESATTSVRKDFADTAYWVGSLDTDAQGRASIKFKMPENVTSWKVRTWVMGDQVRVGSASRDTVTRKNVIVRLQSPRFLVERDEVVLSALVNNDLPESKEVRVRLEIDGQTQLELLPDDQAEQTVRIDSRGQKRVDWRCKAIAEGSVTLKVFAITDVESDAMQMQVPVVVHGILKTDSYAGTVRPDQENSKVKIRIPEERRIEQSAVVVRVSPSLAAAMVDALPYMVDYPYGCTEQTLNRFLPTVITQRSLQHLNIDLAAIAQHRNNLNAQELGEAGLRVKPWAKKDRSGVFDVAQVNDMVEQGIRKLTDMQNSDGGWGWFSGAGEFSYPHTTAVVVRGLLIAQENDVALVPGVLERGLDWLDQYQAGELQKFKNAATDTKPNKREPDQIDALVHHVLCNANRINLEMQQILVEKRQNLSVYGKTLLAIATNQAGNADQTNLLRQNIEQFLEEDDQNETAVIRDQSPWWYWYGSSIEASAMYLKLLTKVEPHGRVAPRIVKHLLNNRKNATYWSSTRDTALVIEAFSDFLKATGETKAEMTAEVYWNDKRIGSVAFDSKNLFTVDNTIQFRGNAIPSGEHVLEIRRRGTGPLYWNAYVTNFTLEAEIESSGLEVQVARHYYRLDPIERDLSVATSQGQVVDAARGSYERTQIEDLQALPSGTLVEVELLVESKNDYEYLLLEDRKPAGLEPVDTQSGYFATGGVNAYRELRDQHVGIFLRSLARGKHALRYQLRSEAPGQFTALPATIYGMYAPELVGNSSDFDLKIIDQER